MIDLSAVEIAIVKTILKQYLATDCEVRVFGSRIDKTARSYSDLDLAIVAKEKIPLGTIFAIKDAFEESELNFRVDILDWNRISSEFQEIIQNKFEILSLK